MRTPSPWWILAPLIILISSCIISIPLSFDPPMPPHNFFDKTDTSEKEKKITFHINEEWLYWIFSSNPNDLSIQAERCRGIIEIPNGKFSRKIPMTYEISEDKITLSFNDMSLICHLEPTNGGINYRFDVSIGRRSLYDSEDTSVRGKIKIRLPEITDQYTEF